MYKNKYVFYHIHCDIWFDFLSRMKQLQHTSIECWMKEMIMICQSSSTKIAASGCRVQLKQSLHICKSKNSRRNKVITA